MINMEYENNLILKRLFTKNSINDLIKNRDNIIFTYRVNRYLKGTNAKKYKKIILFQII